MPTTILTLPTELHEHILHYLPWHDHFLAASALPLWSSLLQTAPFRQKRHFDDLRNQWHFKPSGSISDLVFNRPAPKRRNSENREDVISKLHLHCLLDRCALEISMDRGCKPSMVMNIPKTEQPRREAPKRGWRGGYINGNVTLESEHELAVNSYDITSSPLLLSDTVVYSIGPEKDYPMFDDNHAPVPEPDTLRGRSIVHFRVPLEYPVLLGNEKPQSLAGMLEDIISYMNICFEAERSAEWIRATFIGFGKVHHTDEVHFEIRYGS